MPRNSMLFCIDGNLVIHLGAFLYSVSKNSPRSEFDAYVFHSKLSRDHIEMIQSFERLLPNIKIHVVKVGLSDLDSLPNSSNYITQETYYRFAIQRYLKNVDRIVYFDVDMLVVGDIQALWDIDIKSIGAVRDLFGESARFPKFDSALIRRLRLHRLTRLHKNKLGIEGGYFNAGMLIFDLHNLGDSDLLENLVRVTGELQEKKILKMQDQDALNYYFKNDVTIVPDCYNYQSRNMFEKTLFPEEVRIVHFTGPKKPWSSDEVTGVDQFDLFSELYRKNFMEFNSLFSQ